MKTSLIVFVTILLSAYIGYSDLHQSDTGITVAVLLFAAFVIGLFVTNKAWVYGLILGLGVPVWGIVAALNHWTLRSVEHGQTIYAQATLNSNWLVGLFTIAVAMFGVYTGFFIKKMFSPTKVY
jgi:hypothetical protein